MSGYLGYLGIAVEDEVAADEVVADAGALSGVSSVIPLVAAPLFAYLALKRSTVTRAESRAVLVLAALASGAQALAVLRRWQG
jgi:hypothetical protein